MTRTLCKLKQNRIVNDDVDGDNANKEIRGSHKQIHTRARTETVTTSTSMQHFDPN